MMDIVEGLAGRVAPPLLVAPSAGPLVDWALERNLDVLTIGAPARSGARLLVQAARLAIALRRRRIRILHATAQTCYRAAALAGRWAGARRVCHLGFPPEPGELAWSLGFGVEAVIACYGGQVAEVRPEVLQCSPRARVEHIHYGIDLARFHPEGDRDQQLRAGAHCVFLIVGHLSDVKGYPAFVEAAASVAHSLPGAAFLALGGETASRGYGVQLAERVRRLGLEGRFRLLGFRNDVAGVLRAVDVMVLPSLAEGLPIALIEAMACGRAVITTPVNGIPEAVTDGVHALLVPPSAPEPLAAAMLRLATDRDLAARLGAAARERAEQLFSRDRYSGDVLRLYEELLASR